MLGQKLFNPEISMVYPIQMKTSGHRRLNGICEFTPEEKVKIIINPWKSHEEHNNICFYILTHIFLHLD